MSFLAYLLYLVLSFLRPTELISPDLEEYRPMLWLWIISFGLAVFQWSRSKQVGARPLYFALLGMFVLCIAASKVINSSYSTALTSVTEFSTSAMLFVLTCLNLTTIRRVRIACVALVLSIIAVSSMGIAAYQYGWMMDKLVIHQGTEEQTDVTELEPGTPPAEDTSGQFLWRIRSLGFLNDPNDLAQAITLALPLLWGAYSRRRMLRNLIVVGVPSALLVYAAYLTHSRGGMLGLASLFLFGASRKLGTVKTGVLAVAILFVASVANIGDQRDYSTKEESAGERIEAWYAGMEMVKAQPVLGVGYGNFIDHHIRTAHNSVVLCFAELGLVGYFFWVAMLVLAYRELDQIVRYWPADSPAHKIAYLLRTSLVGYLVCAWFLSRTYTPSLYLLLALCASTAWCARQNPPEAVAGTVANPLPVAWLTPTIIAMAVGIGAVYGFVTLNRLSGG